MLEQRPDFAASYGVSAGASGMVPWAETRSRLVSSRNYWFATADEQGTPHASPVWGIWFDDRLFFGTDPLSRKASNLETNPRAVVHLESGDDVVIVHCEVSTVSDETTTRQVFDLYREKYSMPDDFEFTPVLCATPRYGFAWKEADFPATATKYVR